MKVGMKFVAAAAFAFSLCGCSSSDGGGGGGGPGGNPDAGAGGSEDSGAGASADTGAGTGLDAGGGADGGAGAAAWVGTWSCTSGGKLNGSDLPKTSSTAVITASGDALTVVATTNGSSNPPCTLHGTVTSGSAAAFPSGQSCNITSPVAATLTLTDGSGAALAAGQLATTENVTVSNSPGFNGQMGTLTGTCTK
jgi:hypothetical protein